MPTRAAGQGQGDIRLTTCRLDDDGDIALEEAAGYLSKPEVLRAARFHFDRDRDRYVRGRGYLRRALGRELDRDPAGLAMAEGPRGKPALADPPAGAPDFNLSNSGGLAVLALSRSGPVGVDLELWRSGIDAAALARTCFQDHEISTLMALDGHARLNRFFAFWTAKEALMKLTGQGVWLDPREIALELRDGWPVGFREPAGLAATCLTCPDLGLAQTWCAVASTVPCPVAIDGVRR